MGREWVDGSWGFVRRNYLQRIIYVIGKKFDGLLIFWKMLDYITHVHGNSWTGAFDG